MGQTQEIALTVTYWRVGRRKPWTCGLCWCSVETEHLTHHAVWHGPPADVGVALPRPNPSMLQEAEVRRIHVTPQGFALS